MLAKHDTATTNSAVLEPHGETQVIGTALGRAESSVLVFRRNKHQCVITIAIEVGSWAKSLYLATVIHHARAVPRARLDVAALAYRLIGNDVARLLAAGQQWFQEQVLVELTAKQCCECPYFAPVNPTTHRIVEGRHIE